MMKTFDSISTDLKSTKVVPALETELQAGSNGIWCSSFLAAWKSLSEEVAGADISLEGLPQTATLLTKANDPRPNAPTGSMYVATGWNDKGVIEKIQNDLKAAFPGKQPPTFPGIRPDSFVAYSYLEANVKFALPYFQNRKPLEFTDSRGRKTEVASFGIRPEDNSAYYKLRGQPRILFRKGEAGEAELEFAIDLCAVSSPSQIVLARIKREPNLAKALERVDRELAEVEKLRKEAPDYVKHLLEVIGPNDVLFVPDFFWQISHRFSELEGRVFLNPKLKDQRLDIAQQDILFRLDRRGAELKSEAKMQCFSGGLTYFVLDRPFLICMKKRGEAEPYFALWVDNAELLTPWKK